MPLSNELTDTHFSSSRPVLRTVEASNRIGSDRLKSCFFAVVSVMLGRVVWSFLALQDRTTRNERQTIVLEHILSLPNLVMPAGTKPSPRAQRVTYDLRRDIPFNSTFDLNTKCTVGSRTEKGKRVTVRPNPPHLKTLLEFATVVTTNLKILMLGDSVAIQFIESFEEAVGATSANRYVFRYAWGHHEGLAVSAPVRGGGVVAGWRVTGLFLPSGEGKPLPNTAGGGWDRGDVSALLGHSFVGTDGTNQTVDSFDVMLFRIPHGWLSLDEITQDGIRQSLTLAHDLFGVTTVVLPTLYFQNNIKTEQDLHDLERVNEMIRDTVVNWQQGESGIQTVVLLELGRWTDALMAENARRIGLDASAPTYPLVRLGCKRYAPSIAQICAVAAKEGDCNYCEFNRISRDGMHFCMESISGRFNAAVACLMGCVYNDISSNLRACEKTCNDRFMSLKPIEIREPRTSTTDPIT